MEEKTLLTKEGYLLNKSKFTDKDLTIIKNDLTVKPKITFRAGLGEKPEEFKVYQESKDILSIPKFYGLKKIGEPESNKELKGEKIKFKFKGKLRDYQLEIVKSVEKEVKEKGGGGICVGCGWGKTVMGIYLSKKFKRKTLIVVHKAFLLNQWKDRIEEFTNTTVGIIQQNLTDTDHPIVIGMLQSIAKNKYDIDMFKDFGLVIFDEAHHAPSKFFSKALPIINCRKSIFLTATPKRNDGLDKVLYWYLGDIAYQAASEKNNNVLVKVYDYNLQHQKFKETFMRFTGEVNKAKTITRLTTIIKRNKFIIEIINEILMEDQRKILVLSDRISHLEEIKERLDKFNIYSDFYIGKSKQAKLDKAKEATVILASYPMAAEGLDIPELNTLIMATPRRNIEQSVGRILRRKNHPVQPLIIDLVDMLPSFHRQSIARRRYFKKQGYQIKLFECENNEIKNIIDIKKNDKIEVEDLSNDDVDFID